MKEFKNNNFVIHSYSIPLLHSMYKEALDIGWLDDQPWNKSHIKVEGMNYLKFDKQFTLVFHNHNCGIKVYELPQDWDKVLELISEVVESEAVKSATPTTEFKVGQWLYVVDSGCNNHGVTEGYVGKIKEIIFINHLHPTHYYIFEDDAKCTNRINCTRLATDDEIKQQLIKLARNKGFVDGITFLGCNGSDKDIPIKIGVDHQIKAMIGSINEGVYCGNSWIFHKGKWATIIEDKPITYKKGDRFTYGDDDYILALCGFKKLILISLRDGGYWREPVKVNDILNVTQDEFEDISGELKVFTKLIK